METSKFNDIAARVAGVAASVMLTLFAGFFGLGAIASFVASLIEKDFITVLISGVCAFLGWVCWSIRKDVL